MNPSPAEDRPPSVDRLARHLAAGGLPAPMRVRIAQQAIAEATATGEPRSAWDRAELLERAARRALLQPVVNATGVLLHTNLGRAPVAADRAAGYSNLEIDLDSGRRGDRSSHAGRLLADACGAEAALVVNNGAAAVLLALAAVAGGGVGGRDVAGGGAAGRDVIVSRGELIEIGGGFRIPEVLASSGCRLVEVGTTNRTRISDYERALTAGTGALLKVHTSNYRITGFTASPTVSQLADLAGGSLPVLVDLGSGLLDARCPWLADGPPAWLRGEPAVRQTLHEGADLVTFSCDKLLGGPQAGIVVGRAEPLAAIRRHPLARAVRMDKSSIAALAATLEHYARGEALSQVPIWRMIGAPLDAVRARARRWARQAGVPVRVIPGRSMIGGGSLPEEGVETRLLALETPRPDRLAERLRLGRPAVVARIGDGALLFDPRTVVPDEDRLLVAALRAALPAS